MGKLTTIVTITVPVVRLHKQPATLRLPVLRDCDGLYAVGYRSTHNGFFAIGYGITPAIAYDMWLANNGPELFNSWDMKAGTTIGAAFKNPLWGRHV